MLKIGIKLKKLAKLLAI